MYSDVRVRRERGVGEVGAGEGSERSAGNEEGEGNERRSERGARRVRGER